MTSRPIYYNDYIWIISSGYPIKGMHRLNPVNLEIERKNLDF